MAVSFSQPLGSPAIRRSKYLEDALAALQKTEQPIQSGGELAARLLATAIMQGGRERAYADVADERNKRSEGLAAAIEALGQTSAPPVPQVAPQQQSLPPPPPPPVDIAPLPPAQPKKPDRDRDLLARIIIGEAANQGDDGQQAVAQVVKNRADKSGMSLYDVLTAPKQFEPWGNPKTRRELLSIPETDSRYQQALRNAELVLSDQDKLPPEIDRADHFYSPGTQAKKGRKPPAWDNGRGVDLKDHRFFSLGYGAPNGWKPPPQPDVQMTAGPPPAPPQIQQQFPAQPFQVAQNGGLPPMPQQQAPQPQPQGNPMITPQMIATLKSWATSGDPNLQQMAMQEFYKLQLQSGQPIKYETTSVNGVPVQINPYTGQTRPVDIPQGLQTQTVSGQQLGFGPQGSVYQRKPTGELSNVYTPPSGYDETAQGMQARQGGPADYNNPQNRLEAFKSFRGEVKPILDAATSLRRNVDAVRTGYRQQNGSGDIAMVNGLQKLIDEGVVREGDVALQLGAQGIEGGIAGALAFIQSSGKFSPEIRQKILRTADDLYANLNTTYKERALGYRNIIDRSYGAGSFNDVIPPETINALGWGDQPQGGSPLAQAQGQPRGAQGATNTLGRPSLPQGFSGGLTQQQLQTAQKFRGSAAPSGSQQNPLIARSPEEAEGFPPGSWIILPDGSLGQVPGRGR